MELIITKKSRVAAGRAEECANSYRDVISTLPGGRDFGLDRYDEMPFKEPMVRRRDGFYKCGKLDTWRFHLSKSGNLRDRKGRKPPRKYREVMIIDQFAVPGQEVWS